MLRSLSQGARGVGVRPGTPPARANHNHCGIPPWKDPIKRETAKQRRDRFKLPEHLIRPPCDPNTKLGLEQTCMLENRGLFCPVEKLRYRYPSFSENMDAIPSEGKVCWWFEATGCNPVSRDELPNGDRHDVKIVK